MALVSPAVSYSESVWRRILNPSPEIEALLHEIRSEAREASPWTGRTEIAPQVLAALAAVPRHVFLPEVLRPVAYINRPLPIGHEQTISQPFIVALMTDLLDLRARDRVLEIGTGSGYQAAVLGQLVQQVYTLEIIPALADQARQRLQALGYDNIELRLGDGQSGWPEKAPYDAILVTAAAPDIPPALIRQLKPGGRLLIPIGPRHGHQNLLLARKEADGHLSRQNLLPVIFVPLTGVETP